MARKKRGAPQEEHADETWLIPYSDLLTLLLALFIVLFATSQIDQKKLQEVASAFASAFNGSPSMLNLNNTPQAQSSPLMPKPDGMQQIMPKDEEKARIVESVQLAELKRQVDEYAKNRGLGGQLETSITEDGLLVRIKDTALYRSGSAELLPEARQLGTDVSHMIAGLTQNIVISGHTDNVPIRIAEFPTNWDLSSKRALNFMKYIISQDSNLKPERFSAIGYGEYRPLAPNETTEGRQKNRRVEILIARTHK